MFPFGEEFKRLFAKIPTVLTYFDYVRLCNEIDDARTSYDIAATDEKLLLECLEKYAEARKIPTSYEI